MIRNKKECYNYELDHSINLRINKDYNNEAKVLEYQKTKDINLRNEIVLQNIPLILTILPEYTCPITLTKAELLSEGVIALIRSIELYKPNQNKFSTYAGQAIRKMITTYISDWYGMGNKHHGRLIRIYKKIAFGIYGLDEDIYSDEVVDYVLNIMNESKFFTGDKQMAGIRSKLLSKKIEDVDKDIVESVVYEEEEEVFDRKKFIRKYYDIIMSGLTDLERETIEYMYGLKDGKFYTGAELARKLGVSRQCINAREATAIKKIRVKAIPYRNKEII